LKIPTKKPTPDSTWALLFDNLGADYAAFRFRQAKTKPRPPSSDQMMMVVGSGDARGIFTRSWIYKTSMLSGKGYVLLGITE